MLAFVFHKSQTAMFSTALIPFGDVESEWFIRNREVSSKLKNSNYGYFALSKALENEVEKDNVLYHYNHTWRKHYFVQEGRMLVEITNAMVVTKNVNYDQ